MIRINDLSRDWGDFALRNIDLEIRDDEYFVILGPTGSGKTLLLEVMAGFYTPDRGRVEYRGKDYTLLPPNERDFAFVYQDYMLFPHMTVRENIAYGLRMRKIDSPGRVEEMASAVGVDHLMHRSPLTLSGGEQQRVAIARALVLNPQVLLLDEPYGGLDNQTTVSLRAMVKELHNEFGGTVVHVTHDQEEAVILGDRVAVMRGGEVVQVGSPQEIMRRPSSRFVAEFVGTGNIFRGLSRVDAGASLVQVDGVELHSAEPMEGEVTLTVRPEDIILAREEVRTTARNNFRGEVVDILDRGIFHEVRVDIGVPLVAFVTRQSIEDMDIEVGGDLHVMFKASAVHLFRE
ncbi:MAG: tungstate ABC transporter ATP-binding protein WtpC [Methanomassiliicoccales archaeon]